MPAPSAPELLNLVGFVTGAVLYGMLLALVVRTPSGGGASDGSREWLPLSTAILGLVWNVSSLTAYALPRIGLLPSTIGLTALSFPALGLLAAVVVHSVAGQLPYSGFMTAIGYGCSVAAGLLHLHTVITGDPSSSSLAFGLLTVWFGLVIIPLAALTRAQTSGRRALWMLALALFAVSASHLGRFHGNESNWIVELVGHHAAIPLAFAILYQDYRFALADLFLKRAISLLALVALAFAGYSLAASLPEPGPLTAGALLALWVATAVISPWLQRHIAQFVDRVLLGRADYSALSAAIGEEVLARDSVESVLDTICARLAPALSARVWWEIDRAGEPPATPPSARVVVPTAEHPEYVLLIGGLQAGRRLLSDDIALAEAVASIAARRIDALRVAAERFERQLQEQEMLKLAAEAELRALRAQVNPHFLFNALTTLGYLIEAAPARATKTLLRLTALLRGVLRSDGEFTTLGREIELVEHYLDIERERFEERLRVTLDVPRRLRAVQIPSLIVQPLVENAVKHGIAPSISGGALDIRVRLDDAGVADTATLRIIVRNTGAPLSPSQRDARESGVGLENVRRRLAGHFGPSSAHLSIGRDAEGATVAQIELPVEVHETARLETAGSPRRL